MTQMLKHDGFLKRKVRVASAMRGTLLLSSTISTLTVLLIFTFLFKEGIGLFSRPIVEDYYAVLIHPDNPVREFDSEMIRLIYEGAQDNWSDFGGPDMPIDFLSINNLSEKLQADVAEGDRIAIRLAIGKYVNDNKAILAVIPKNLITGGFNDYIVEVPHQSLGSFIGGERWLPTARLSPQFGVLPILLGTLWVTIGAIAFSLPLGLGVAIYMAELVPARLYGLMKTVVELLAGIPSVVYGFFGLVVVVPNLQQLFGIPVGETALAGSLLLGVMALPTIITISEDAIRNVPQAMRDASLALGSNKWQTIWRVVIPYGKSGIGGAAVLGVGRAMGETMAVLMVTGNSGLIPTTFLQPVRTITATIAAEMGEAPAGGSHYQALFALGILLFFFTFLINLVLGALSNKRNQMA